MCEANSIKIETNKWVNGKDYEKRLIKTYKEILTFTFNFNFLTSEYSTIGS